MSWGKEPLVSENGKVICVKYKNSHLKLYLKENAKENCYLLRVSFPIISKNIAWLDKYNLGIYHTQKLLCSIFYPLLQHKTCVTSLDDYVTTLNKYLHKLH